MKYLLLALLSICLSVASAQTDFDDRLLAKFSEEHIADLSKTNPEVISYWEYYLDNSYTIAAIPSGKSMEGIEEVKIKDINNFNILALDVHMDREVRRYYRIKGSNQILVMLSNKDFSKKFNVHRGLH